MVPGSDSQIYGGVTPTIYVPKLGLKNGLIC